MAFLTRLIFTLMGMAFAVLFAVAVFCGLAFYVAFASLRWLVTGQKPQVLLIWQQIQALFNGMKTGQSAGWSSWSRTSDGQWHEAHRKASGDDKKAEVIEDAVVREIHDTRRLPKE
jgi:hypothetical protein